MSTCGLDDSITFATFKRIESRQCNCSPRRPVAADAAIYLDAIAIKKISAPFRAVVRYCRSKFCCYSIHILLAHCRRRRTSVLFVRLVEQLPRVT